MEITRAANSLGALLRLAFVGVVGAAVIVDLWVIGELWMIERNEFRPSVVVVCAIGLVGAAWAKWPHHALLLAVAASILSLLQTTQAPNVGLRIGVFTEFVVMPVLLAAVLMRPSVSRWPVAWLVVVAAESMAFRAEETAIRAIIATSMLVLLGTAAGAVVYIRLRDSERRASIDAARAEERLELARELHDVVGHHVTGIVVLAQARRFTVDAATVDPTADRAFADIEAAGLETLTSVRRLIGLLRTDPSTSTGPRLADIELVVNGLRTTHPGTELVVDDAVREHWVPADLALTVQRLVQESATNVRRHGDPSAPVRFTIRIVGATLELTVNNRVARSGVGVGYGLIGMQERVDALGGRFDAAAVGDQWTVRAELPLSVQSS